MTDQNPPPWRGQPLSTFQHWEFSAPGAIGDPEIAPWDHDLKLPPDTKPLSPEHKKNPCEKAGKLGKPYAVVQAVDPPATEWLKQYAGREGVWRIEPHTVEDAEEPAIITLWIPNCEKKGHKKSARVQVTYKIGPPSVDPINSLTVVTESTEQLQDGWDHVTWDLAGDCDRDGEQIDIESEGPCYIDEIVVDTICTKPEHAYFKGTRKTLGEVSLASPVRVVSRKAPKATASKSKRVPASNS